MLVKSLPPIIDEQSRVLILGPAPDEDSARKRRYYAERYNIFWDVIATAFDFELPLQYGDRVSFLKEKGIALWYVVAECGHEGDFDSTITNDQPNDFAWLFSTYPSIEAVLFNGRKAERLYRRHFGLPSQASLRSHRLPFSFEWATMPSTSAMPVKPMRYVRPCADRLNRGASLVRRFAFGGQEISAGSTVC